MKKLQILIVGRNLSILRILHRLVNANDAWLGITAETDEEAIRIFEEQEIDLVLLSSGIPEESEKNLRDLFLIKNPQIKIIQHFGGGSGLLENEIRAAFDGLDDQLWIKNVL